MGFQFINPARFELVGGGGGSIAVRGFAAVLNTISTLVVTQAAFSVAPQSGDVVLIFTAEYFDSGGGGSGSSSVSGFTVVDSSTNGDWKQTCYKRVAGGSEGTYTVAGGSAWLIGGAIAVCISGATAVDVGVAAALGIATHTTVVAPTVSPSGSTDLLLGFAAHPSGNAITQPGSMTSVASVADGSGIAMRLGRETLSASGATGTRTFTCSSSGGERGGVSVAIN